MTQSPTYIAMWSGPRNISTAMLRAWENRPDTFVVDEPLYAHFLSETGLEHPGGDDIIRAYENDWRKVFNSLTGPIPNEKPIYYQKHMTHHWLPHIDFGVLDKLTNCFLIREPAEMITSYIRVRSAPTIEDTGYPQQLMLFNYVREQLGVTPPVIDSRAVLENPREQLGRLCEAVGVPFSENMLKWPAGKRETDGNWAPYWYSSVEASTEFAGYRPKNEPIPPHLQKVYEQAQEIYEQIHPYHL